MRSTLSLLFLIFGLQGLTFAATTNVTVSNFSFSPASITVNVGDTVHWSNSGGTHNVNADGGSFINGAPSSAAWTFDNQFNTAGAFAYYCQVHGSAGGGGMSGVVNVAVAPTATETPTSTETPTITATFTISETPTGVPFGSTLTETPTSTFTATPTATPSATRTVTATATPGSPVIQLFDKSPELILAPNPQKIGQPICLYSNSISQESHWNVYNTALERVASLDFLGPDLQCWDTSKCVPGLYYIDAKWTLANGGIKRVKQKVVLWR